MRDRSQLSDVGPDHLMAKFLKLFANPNGVNASLHGNTCVRHVREPLPDRLRWGPEQRSRSYLQLKLRASWVSPVPVYCACFG